MKQKRGVDLQGLTLFSYWDRFFSRKETVPVEKETIFSQKETVPIKKETVLSRNITGILQKN